MSMKTGDCWLIFSWLINRWFSQELKQTIGQYEELVKSLGRRSLEVVPLRLRSQRHYQPLPLVALCSYKQLNVSLFGNVPGLLSDDFGFEFVGQTPCDYEEEEEEELGLGAAMDMKCYRFRFLSLGLWGGWPVLSLTISSSHWQCMYGQCR